MKFIYRYGFVLKLLCLLLLNSLYKNQEMHITRILDISKYLKETLLFLKYTIKGFFFFYPNGVE